MTSRVLPGEDRMRGGLSAGLRQRQKISRGYRLPLDTLCETYLWCAKGKAFGGRKPIIGNPRARVDATTLPPTGACNPDRRDP